MIISDLPFFLTPIATIVFIVAFVLYNKDILKESTKPNIVTWSLFVLVTLINALSYISMTGDPIKSILAFTDFIACLIITCLILFKGRYLKLGLTEKLVIVFSLLSIFIWFLLRSATYANLLLQVAYVLAFVPTYVGVYKNASVERALPWLLWTISFIINLLVIALRWNVAWQDFVNPVVAIVLHFGLALLVARGSNYAQITLN